MSTTIKLKTASGSRKLREPFPGADHAVAEGYCPACQVKPFRVAGKGKHIATDDRAYESEGYCVDCGAYLGTIRAEVSTLFGLRADDDLAEYCASRGIRVY